MPDSSIRNAAAIILVRDDPKGKGQVYFVKRHRGAGFMANAFVFPGGVRDPEDSDDKATAIRECEEEANIRLTRDALTPWAHWITPTIEKRRYSARFFLARLPAGQTPQVDHQEVVDDCWLTPSDIDLNSISILLPPPQLRTLFELKSAGDTCDDWLRQAKIRSESIDAFVPEALPNQKTPVLVLPWDPEYSRPKEKWQNHPLAFGPSRFILEQVWKHI